MNYHLPRMTRGLFKEGLAEIVVLGTSVGVLLENTASSGVGNVYLAPGCCLVNISDAEVLVDLYIAPPGQNGLLVFPDQPISAKEVLELPPWGLLPGYRLLGSAATGSVIHFIPQFIKEYAA